VSGAGQTFSWITPELAVGGSFPQAAAEALAREHGVSAVVDLRSETCDDEALLRRHGVNLLHLPTDDLCAVDQPMLDRGVAYVTAALDRGARVLIHCEHGIGRSVTLALCVLVRRGFAPLQAMEAIKTARRVASPSPEQFEAWSAWLGRHGYPPPSFDAFKAIAYRHLQGA
jgi:protein-tyrosine phosphatase